MNDYQNSKVLPSSREAEHSVLGACLIDSNAFQKIAEKLDAGDFYYDNNARVFTAMTSLHSALKPIDVLSVNEEMKRVGWEDAVHLTELTMCVSSSANVEYHARYVKEKSMLRGIITAGRDMMIKAQNEDEDAVDLLNASRDQLDKIDSVIQIKKTRHVSDGVRNAAETILAMRNGERITFGTSTGYKVLDNHFGGFEEGQLIVLAARPSMGKTSLMLSMARNVASHIPVDIFSLEMPEKEIVLRLLSGEANIPYYYLKLGKYGEGQARDYARAIDTCSKLMLNINDQASLGLADLKNKIRLSIRERGTKGFFIDYLGLMRMSGANRDIAIGEVTRGLKEVCKDFGVWIVLLSQLNRSLEYRPNKRPVLADLRESGNIEQDADVVLFVHRPEVYGEKNMEDGRPSAGLAEIIIGKNRNGKTGVAELVFRKDYMRFENMETAVMPTGEVGRDTAI